MSSSSPSSAEITLLLKAWGSGDEDALVRLAPLVYGELHRMAKGRMFGERPEDTLQPTALVHEAYLRLVDSSEIEWRDRTHFFALCAQTMRRILIDRARARCTEKRGRAMAGLRLDNLPEFGTWRPKELVALDDALSTLEKMDPRKAKMIELRFFAGLSIEDTAKTLEISKQTVDRDWKLARAWLERELSQTCEAKSNPL